MDSAVLIMPLVFFTSAADTRFVSTLEQILKTPERGGLTANNTVFRYDTEKVDDGVGGEEGAFSMCTLWAIGECLNVSRHIQQYLMLNGNLCRGVESCWILRQARNDT